MSKYLSQNKINVFIDILFSSLYSAAIGAIPIVTKELLDDGINLSSKKLMFLIIIYVLLAGCSMLFQYISQCAEWKWCSSIERSLRYDLLDKILNYNYDDYNVYTKDEYLSIFSNDIATISEQYFTKKVDIIKSSLMVMIYAGYMFYFLNFWIAIVIIVSSLLSLFLPKITGKALSDRKLNYINSLGTQSNVISDILHGFTLINIRTKGNLMKHFNRTATEVKNLEIKYGTYKAFTIVFNGFVMYLLDISAFSIAGILLVLNKITLGTATATLSYVKTFVWPIRYVIEDINEINAAKEVVKKYLMIIDRKIVSKQQIDLTEGIQYKELSVKYDNFELYPFSYEFKKGKKYLLVGHSGSGKSTILNCLVGIENGYDGKVKIDQTDVNQLDLSYTISGINKGNHIFNDTVMNNITLFGSCSCNKLFEYLKKYPNDKINKLITMTNSSELSNGERQMVSLLRTYCLDTPVIVLDEAFSAIDLTNRAYFIDMFLEDKQKTVIVISHNFDEQSINKVDQTICLHQGKITELEI